MFVEPRASPEHGADLAVAQANRELSGAAGTAPRAQRCWADDHTAPAIQLGDAVLRLVRRGLAVDNAILKQTTQAPGSAGRPSLGELVELKRWLVQALFAIAPRALIANPERRREILDALSAFRDSHQAAQAVLAEPIEQMHQEPAGQGSGPELQGVRSP